MSAWAPSVAPSTKFGAHRPLSSRACVRVPPVQLGAMSIGDKWDKFGLGSMDKEGSCSTRSMKQAETLSTPRTTSECLSPWLRAQRSSFTGPASVRASPPRSYLESGWSSAPRADRALRQQLLGRKSFRQQRDLRQDDLGMNDSGNGACADLRSVFWPVSAIKYPHLLMQACST